MKIVVALVIFSILAVCVRGQGDDGEDGDNVAELRERVSGLIASSDLASRASGSAASALERVVEKFRTLSREPERSETVKDVFLDAARVVERTVNFLRSASGSGSGSGSGNRG